MKAVTEARKKEDADVIESINDNRNGVMLNAVFHPELRKGHITFLVVSSLSITDFFLVLQCSNDIYM